MANVVEIQDVKKIYRRDNFDIEVLSGALVSHGDRLYFLSNALKQLPVGLEEVSDGVWSVFFCHVLLARLDECTHTLIRG